MTGTDASGMTGAVRDALDDALGAARSRRDGEVASYIPELALADPGDASVGALLLAAVGLARAADVDPETALRGAAAHLRDSARAVETAPPPP